MAAEKVRIVLQEITSLNIFANLLQAHICCLNGDHRPGLDCLSDEQIFPLLHAMDSESLLNCRRASPRLYRLVCDQQVWRQLLTGIEISSDRLEELLLFGKGPFEINGQKWDGGSVPELMPEVVKEAARRFANQLRTATEWDRTRVSVAIQGWGTEDTFEMDGNLLEGLGRVAEKVGAKFKIVVWNGGNFVFMAFMDTFKMISSHIAQQEEKVLSLKFNQVDAVFVGLLFPLMRASKEWSILNLNFDELDFLCRRQ